MAEKGIFGKIKDAADTWLDSYVSTARASTELEMMKAKSGLEDEKFYRRSLYLPTAYQFSGAGYKEKTTRIGYQTLRLMSYRDSVIAAIIQTRMNQVATYSRPQKDRFSPGFVFEFKDKNQDVGEEGQKQLASLQEFICNTGINKDRPRSEYMSFEEMVRRIVRDRLTFDQVAIEKIHDGKGDLHHLAPVDASTIRFAASQSRANQSMIGIEKHGRYGVLGENKIDSQETEAEKDREKAEYVQVIDGMVKRVFTSDELILRFGNPTNDIYANGYSLGELELLISIVTSHMHAESYNKLFFTQGHVTKGLLHLEANVPQHKLEALKQQWYAQTTGNANSWRTPIFAGVEKVNWIPLTQSNRDMEFNSWLAYLIKIACAIYQINPSEIGFDISRGTGESQGSGGIMEANISGKLEHSMDKGLRPLLVMIEDVINEEIIDKINPDVVFRFVGYDADNKMSETQRLTQEVRYRTLDEVRTEIGAEKLGKKKGGHLILDPVYFQWLIQFGEYEAEQMKKKQEEQMQQQQEQMQQQQEMQQQQMGQGQPGQEGGQPGQEPGQEGEQQGQFGQIGYGEGEGEGEEVNEDMGKEPKEGEKKAVKKSNGPKLLKIEYFRK